MDAIMATVKTPAITGAERLQAPQRGELPGAPALVDPPHQDEQGGDDQAVVDHLEDAAGDPWLFRAKVPRTMNPIWASDE